MNALCCSEVRHIADWSLSWMAPFAGGELRMSDG
jgi:hypothetical protein